ncbi:MAG TPA: aa3-type cytochrome c oxidase subunit IV [Allosphingosinicella sp.]|nr:aa3-type cytochrome c oxidase subunit IV [Allosphingosinicella sp.]
MADGEAREFKAHEKSYGRFIFMMKWGTILSAITAFIVIMVIQ